jgi:hypothetical protein
LAAIRDLTLRPVDLPLGHPVETASGLLRTAAPVVLDVRDEDGDAIVPEPLRRVHGR